MKTLIRTTEPIGLVLADRWVISGIITGDSGTKDVLVQDAVAQSNDEALMAWFAMGKVLVLTALAARYPDTSPLTYRFPTAGRITPDAPSDTDLYPLVTG